jgi:hypothetical protein
MVFAAGMGDVLQAASSRPTPPSRTKDERIGRNLHCNGARSSRAGGD